MLGARRKQAIPSSADDARRVLLAEDDEDLRKSLSAVLELKGFTVVQAANGADALRKLHSEPLPRLVIMDLTMPEMDGWALRREMLARRETASVPVVVVSALDIDDPGPLQAIAHFTKPVDFPRLYALLERCCTPRRSGDRDEALSTAGMRPTALA